MNNRGTPILPPRWLNCPRMGDMILDIFIPFKTPLDSKFDHVIPSENIFHMEDVFQTAEPIFADSRPPGIYKSDYLEDLFERYGSREDCPPAPPRPSWCFGCQPLALPLDEETTDQLKRQHSPTSADEAKNCVGIKQKRSDQQLHASDSLMTVNARVLFYPPPKGTPCLMPGVHRVTTLDQGDREAHEARELADKLIRVGGCVYATPGGQLVPADNQSSDSETNDSVDAVETDVPQPETSTGRCSRKRAYYFKGSQPVSICQRNMEALVNRDYCVTYKADGVRYLLLITGPDKVYIIDRANFVYKVDTLHFPSVAWVKRMSERTGGKATSGPVELLDGHLTNTLLDGEMILCRDPDKQSSAAKTSGMTEASGTARFLIYDMITLNGRPIGRCPFFDRYTAIDKEIIWPRNTAGHMNLVDFSIQSFSVRRKTFRPLNQTEEPCGPDEFYVLGTCPQQLKWKPPNLNTIDFRCKIVYQSKVGEIPGYVGLLYLGGLNVPSARLSHVGPKDKSLDGKIVECTIDPTGGGWKVLRVRTDKTEPNYHKSGVAIIESILSPVTTQHLLSCVRQRGLRLQAKLQPSASTSSSSAMVATTTGIFK